MHLADHIRPLLRDHDCVIIPDFGGLVADAAPARLQPGRQAFSPPSKLVAFNQALTRNDGLLVDALAQHTGVSIAQAREIVRQAVAELKNDLHETNRTELPGIGIFRRAAGRGLSFEYTGSDNLLPAAYGLPEVVVRPVLNTNVRLAREKAAQPALRTAGASRSNLKRFLPATAVALVAMVLLSANYLGFLGNGNSLRNWQVSLAGWEQQAKQTPVPSLKPEPVTVMPQQATLGQHSWSDNGEAPAISTPQDMPGTTAPIAEEAFTAAPEAVSPASETASSSEEKAVKEVPVAVEAPAPKLLAPKAAAKAPVAISTAPEEKKAPAVAAAVPAPAPKSPSASSTIKARTGRFYVIAGAFRTLASAEKVRSAQKNGKARVILPPAGSRLYRLSVADFADKASAEQEARRLRTKARSTNSHLVLNY